jgi:methylated-DNA-[protein]-cysteine S-methyltransferase
VSVAVDLEGPTPVIVASCLAPLADLESVLERVGLADTRRRRDRDPGGVLTLVGAWVDGDRDAILRPVVKQPGGPFRQAAWSAMRRIRGGTVTSYADLAAAAGNERAVRAAGTACAINAAAPFVPCHRVVRTGGSLGNYYYGTDIKQAILRHERALPA